MDSPRVLGDVGVSFLLSLALFYSFDPDKPSLQLVERAGWLPTYGINYFVGIDGISFWLVMLSIFLTPLVILASWTAIEEKFARFTFVFFFF